MSKNSAALQGSAPEQPAAPEQDNPRISDDIESQVRRLRQILTLMAPETGTVALGSARRTTSHMPITERVRLLTEYRR
jgi:hypothetical protein